MMTAEVYWFYPTVTLYGVKDLSWKLGEMLADGLMPDPENAFESVARKMSIIFLRHQCVRLASIC